jgi:hypothetical protein
MMDINEVDVVDVDDVDAICNVDEYVDDGYQ